MSPNRSYSRRRLLQDTVCYAATTAALRAGALPQRRLESAVEQNKVEFSQIHGRAEQDEKASEPFLNPENRLGYAIVGLGRLSLNQIMPAFGECRLSRPAALVSGDRAKALKVAKQYGIPETSIYDYHNYEQLATNDAVQALYIVLPNGMHEEYVLRGAKTGKHILCEKPMATSSSEARRMMNACMLAKVKLMIAYRQQYEPNNLALRRLVSDGKLGRLRGFLASNSQQQGDPKQWRLNKALAGGGCLPDVGLYCINAARFHSNEEPVRVAAQLWQPKEDPRFREVEASVSFSMHFPSGYVATCTTSYDVHKSQTLRLEGTDAWADMNPAFAYSGNKLRWSGLDGDDEVLFEPRIEEKNQFSLEIDHFSECILGNNTPQTPGEEGLRDHLIMEAIYRAASTGRAIDLPV